MSVKNVNNMPDEIIDSIGEAVGEFTDSIGEALEDMFGGIFD